MIKNVIARPKPNRTTAGRKSATLCQHRCRRRSSPPAPGAIDQFEAFAVSTILLTCGLARRCWNGLSRRQQKAAKLVVFGTLLTYINPDLRQTLENILSLPLAGVR